MKHYPAILTSVLVDYDTVTPEQCRDFTAQVVIYADNCAKMGEDIHLEQLHNDLVMLMCGAEQEFIYDTNLADLIEYISLLADAVQVQGHVTVKEDEFLREYRKGVLAP